MLRIEIKQPYKSIPRVSAFELSDFSVITGKNGSGKSHFLQVLAKSDHAEIKLDGRALKAVQLVKFGDLIARSDVAHDPAKVAQFDDAVWKQIVQFKATLKASLESGRKISPEVFLRNREIDAKTKATILRVIERANDLGIVIDQLTKLQVKQLDLGASGIDDSNVFGANLATIFNTYNVRLFDNDVQNYRYDHGLTPERGLSKAEFEARLGPRPWILINSILHRAGLTYEVVAPEDASNREQYQLQFIDTETGNTVSLDDLSTGEKVLMALGLAIFRTSKDGGKPDILLLDEPDAPLHPDYSRLLIDVLREEVVTKAGVCVVMTTHSPSTVAMCSDLTVYEMIRGKGRPVEISREAGVKILTRDIPNLRISTEARRQVFVESKYDVNFLERIFSALNHMRRFEFEPVFLEPHSGTTNCSDVYGIVEALAKSGSDLVRGIVDWDCRNVDGKGVFVLGGGRRYAIENYILDPFFVGLSLVRCGKRKFADFGVSSRHSYSHARDMTQKEVQDIADRILADVGLELKDLIPSPLINGHTAQRPSAFLKMNGHDWEALVIEKIPELNFLLRGRREEDRLKKPVLEVVVDCCEFLPLEVRETLENLA